MSVQSIAPPADSAPTLSPGRELARALADAPDAAEVGVDLAISLPTTFPFFATRPRYTVRHLLGSLPTPGPTVPYVAEPSGAGAPSHASRSYATSPEAAFEPVIAHAELTQVKALVALPAGLRWEPELLARHIDRRVVVRLCTVENQVLLHGSDDAAIPGLLAVPGRRVARGRGSLDTDLAWAAALVEETGGSCDGMVVHPEVYWSLVTSGQLARLNAVGVRVSRTRMIAPDRALLGDFRAVATLLDPARSRLTLRREGGRDVVEAALWLGLAVHLPQHLVLVDLAEKAA